MTDKKNNSKKSNLLWIILAIVVVAFCGYSFLTSDLKHIEDTNGADDYSLVTITDENIIKKDMGALNVSLSTDTFNSGATVKSSKFTGVYSVFQTYFLLDSDFEMDLTGFWVNSGNFKMAIVNEGKIIATVEPDMFTEVRLENLKGSLELVIAGESADFEFTLDRTFCEQYGIEVGE